MCKELGINVTLKVALTLDGKIATASGNSKWITGEAARNKVHELRNQNSAILVGTKTIMNDNPQLTCREKKKGVRHPARIILDRRNKIPLKAKVFANSKKQQVIYIAGPKLSMQRKKYLVER